MSYLVLARKSRPQTFAQVVGQRSVVRTLQNSILRDRVAHAILFSGVRGVGKTTIARIMAKAINCQAEAAARPCDLCPSCREIASGSSLDLTEIDGASNRGIQEIRELKERIKFHPTSSKYRIIIIDEVHMLTTEAFNALLKTLEEPPAHVYFMFATTEIHKIPVTILSRCQQYELKRVGAAELYDHFQRLAAGEGYEMEPAAMSLIVREAAGSVRDGLSLLDQMFSFGERHIAVQDVVEVLGLVDREVLLRLSRGLLEKNAPLVLATLGEVFSFGTDLKRFLEDLMAGFRTLLLCKLDGCDSLIDLPAEELALHKQIAADYSRETLHQKLALLMRAAEELKFSGQPRLLLETSFLAIIEADNVVAVSTLLSQVDKILASLPLCPPASPQATLAPVQQAVTPTQPASVAAVGPSPAVPAVQLRSDRSSAIVETTRDGAADGRTPSPGERTQPDPVPSQAARPLQPQPMASASGGTAPVMAQAQQGEKAAPLATSAGPIAAATPSAGPGPAPGKAAEGTFHAEDEKGPATTAATLASMAPERSAATQSDRSRESAPSPGEPPAPIEVLSAMAAARASQPTSTTGTSSGPAAHHRAAGAADSPAAASSPPAGPQPTETATASAAAKTEQAPSAAEKPPRAHSHERDVRRDWLQFIAYVKEKSMWMSQDLQRADSYREVDGELRLTYGDPANCLLLRQKEHRHLLNELAVDFFQKPLKVRFAIPSADEPTESNGEAPSRKRAQLASDPLVLMAVEIFNGEVGDIRIGPSNR
mgnify:FL=1